MKRLRTIRMVALSAVLFLAGVVSCASPQPSTEPGESSSTVPMSTGPSTTIADESAYAERFYALVQKAQEPFAELASSLIFQWPRKKILRRFA